MKIEVCNSLIKLTELLPQELGSHMKGVVLSLYINLKHNRSKVRKSTLKAICAIIALPKATYLLSDGLPQLRVICNDKIKDVRETMIDCVQVWLNKFDYKHLKQFEAELLLYLLNGSSDENPEISKKSLEIIEDYGSNLKKLMEELEEENIGDVNEDSFTPKYEAMVDQQWFLDSS
eukprot:TRINITY_DN1150_c0_g1_i1.p3 TRINITY_DN1150_c0_g1~~TRINITY_DN1150_c0_g1_i1.p3  ORF type:complete len:176 (-),score=20.83 TRINITY_DN1150_c0_g1_i1:6-533(-)